jgi:hypothetical protein
VPQDGQARLPERVSLTARMSDRPPYDSKPRRGSLGQVGNGGGSGLAQRSNGALSHGEDDDRSKMSSYSGPARTGPRARPTILSHPRRARMPSCGRRW